MLLTRICSVAAPSLVPLVTTKKKKMITKDETNRNKKLHKTKKQHFRAPSYITHKKKKYSYDMYDSQQTNTMNEYETK